MIRFRVVLVPFLIVSLGAACGQRRSAAEKSVENGVEIVLNHRIPDRPGRPEPFALVEIFRIDSETESRLGDIRGFETNAAGAVFVLGQSGGGDFIFKYDSRGRFIQSFGRKGQGPGEMQYPRHLALGPDGRIVISEMGRLLEYDGDGGFLRTVPLDFSSRVTAGPDGTWIAQNVGQEFRADGQTMTWSLRLLDPGYGHPRPLDSLSAEISKTKLPFPEPLLCWSVSRDRVFVANQERGYDICVYDAAGTLRRRIKKDFTPVPVSDPFKEKVLKPLPEPMRKAVEFPATHPPFQALAASDDGRLFVATFEPGAKPGEFLFDVFDPDGVLSGRASLSAFIWESHLWMKISSGILYVLAEKANGYKEIVASRILWE
jgi:hypothetical protein